MRLVNIFGPAGPFPGALALQRVAIDAVAGLEALHCFDSFGEPTAGVTYTVDGPGSATSTVWRWTPTGADVGVHKITIRATANGQLIGRVPLRVTVRPALASGSVRVVLAGDSITATDAVDAWTNRFFRYLTDAGISWTSLGQFATTNADAGVRHEAISGRTWRWFEGLEDQGTYQTPWDNDVSVASYVAGTCSGVAPTHVHYQLGPNDSNAFGGAPEDRDAYFDTVAAASLAQIARWKANYPNTIVSVGGVLPPNSRDAAFGTPGTTERQAYRVKRAAMLRRAIVAWRSVGAHVIATHACVDSVDGFDAFNNVHPEVTIGHAQIARAVYAGIRGLL